MTQKTRLYTIHVFVCIPAGGWGPALATNPAISIPSRDVQFLNNILVNPKNESSMWSHFSVGDALGHTNASRMFPFLCARVGTTASR